MWRWARRARLALAPTALVGVAGLCELAERADDASKVQYAERRLLALRSAATADQDASTSAGSSAATSDAWLNAEAPQFPYLLAVSSGDEPGAVVDGVLHGALVIGRRECGADAMATQLCGAPTLLGQAVQSVAGRWKELKAGLHAPEIPDAFDPRVSVMDIARSAVLTALEQIQQGEADVRAGTEDVSASDDPDYSSAGSTSSVGRRFVFVLAAFDEMGDKQAEKWLQWTNKVTANGLAHVVIPTQKAVTPERVQWFQARHQASDKDGNFVAILLRVAKDAVDRSSARDKVHKVALTLGLGLHGDTTSADGYDNEEEEFPRDDEVEIIAKTTGNWWGDICVVCSRLARSGLNDVQEKEERLAAIHGACDEFMRDTTKFLTSQVLDLDTDVGSLHRLRAAVGDAVVSTRPEINSRDLASAEDRALKSLETWRCLEAMAGLESAGGSGRASVIGSAQELVARGDRPPNCVHPVNALLAFNSRPEGERKFLALIDDNVLLLRPKTDVEIGVVPCETTALLSPCWVEVRPAIKQAFEKLWRDDKTFAVVQALERLSISLHLRDEILLFEQEIHDRERTLDDMQGEFNLRQYALSPAEQAQRKAEIALIQVELDAKHVYLGKLRSLG